MKVAILGAGVSGLTCAWFLKKYHPHIEVSVFEKQDRPGGCIQTIHKEGYLFELGPHTLRVSQNSEALFQLIEDLHLQAEILLPDPRANKRYIYHKQKLRPFPRNLWSLFYSPFTIPLLKAVCKDLVAPKADLDDESIHSFAIRRFGKEAAELFVDPLISGIFAGDTRQLSLRSCFPYWFEAEKNYGSVIKSLIRNHKHPHSLFEKYVSKHRMFTFNEGQETLIKALSKKLKNELNLSTEVLSIKKTERNVEIHTSKGVYRVDHVISAMPAYAFANIFESETIQSTLQSILFSSVASVHFGYNSSVLKKSGFGYLIPQREKQQILGCIWDSSIFPEQCKNGKETRLTILLGGSHFDIGKLNDLEILDIAIEAASKHMGIKSKPKAYHIHRASNSLPQYHLGFNATLAKLNEQLKTLPYVSCLGSSFYGVSVVDCISYSEQFAKQKVF